MRTFFTSWLVGDWSYPGLTAVCSSAVKAASLVIATWLVTLALRNRSSLLRSWTWRACFVALVSTLLWLALPAAVEHWRPAVPVLVDFDRVRSVVHAAQQASLINHQPSPKARATRPPQSRSDSVFDADINKEATAALASLRVDWIAVAERAAFPVWVLGALVLVLWRIVRAACGLWWLRRHSRQADQGVSVAHQELRSLSVCALNHGAGPSKNFDRRSSPAC